jgi:hypothetical protein
VSVTRFVLALVAALVGAGCAGIRERTAPNVRRQSADDDGKAARPREDANVPSAEAAAPTSNFVLAEHPTQAPRVKPETYPYQAPITKLHTTAPASRYASLSPRRCRAELEKRQLPVKRERRMRRGVAHAVRVTGHFNEVLVRKPASPSPFGVLDCRLALALDDLTKLLAEFEIGHIHVGTMYREGARIAHRGTKSQHASGLALDVLSFRHRDGRMLLVERDWHAEIGDVPCGPDAVMRDPTPESILLRNVVCEIARRQVFHVVLTPSANRAHHDHLHFDIKRRERELTLR